MKIFVTFKTAVFFVALWACGTPAMAELCDDPKLQADIDYCSKYNFTKSDNELNYVYRLLKKAYEHNPAPMTALQKAQRAWITFRDAECKQDEVAADLGSAAPNIILQCKTRLTYDRFKQLSDRLDCKEGDMSCITSGDAAN